jgi:hypothetical protein
MPGTIPNGILRILRVYLLIWQAGGMLKRYPEPIIPIPGPAIS